MSPSSKAPAALAVLIMAYSSCIILVCPTVGFGMIFCSCARIRWRVTSVVMWSSWFAMCVSVYSEFAVTAAIVPSVTFVDQLSNVCCGLVASLFRVTSSCPVCPSMVTHVHVSGLLVFSPPSQRSRAEPGGSRSRSAHVQAFASHLKWPKGNRKRKTQKRAGTEGANPEWWRGGEPEPPEWKGKARAGAQAECRTEGDLASTRGQARDGPQERNLNRRTY